MYPWQAAALELGEDGSNLVYCAPTSGGKSLVAEVLLVRAMLHRKQNSGQPHECKPTLKKALVVLPYISIVNEKTAHLSTVLQPLGCKVKGYFGSEEGTPLQPRGEHVAVCSIEKAGGTINRMAQEGRLSELACVIIDEVHMVADPNRGVALELALTQLMHAPAAAHVQIVCMSATMGGLETMSEWLDARLFITNYRPVPLTEHAVLGGRVFLKKPKANVTYDSQGSWDEDFWPLDEVRELPASSSKDADRLVPLVAEVVAEGHSVLVFCAGRVACQNCAEMLTDLLPRAIGPLKPEVVEAREAAVAALQDALGGHSNEQLERMMRAGIAYHHAGLTSEERCCLEAAYRRGALLVLTATSTLAAGINLPARRVILRSLWQGAGNVSRAQYLQMVGRAGRAGQSSVGESFIIGKGAPFSPRGGDWSPICALITAPLPRLASRLVAQDALAADLQLLQGAAPPDQLLAAQPHLQRLLLESLANGAAADGDSIHRLIRSTLASRQMPYDTLAGCIRVALMGLRVQRLITLLPDMPGCPSHWQVTAKGRAVYDSSLPTSWGVLLYGELDRLRRFLVLGSNLHLILAVLPEPLFQLHSWIHWSDIFATLSPEHRRVAELEALLEGDIMAAINGRRLAPALQTKHARFASALMLDRLVSEGDVHSVEREFGQPKTLTDQGLSRGQLQKMQSDLAKWSAMGALLAGSAGWWQLEVLLGALAQQAAAGVRPELIKLMQVPLMTPPRARALHQCGITSPELLALAEEEDVRTALARALPHYKKSAADRRLAVGVAGDPASNALVARAAKQLLASAQQHLVATAQLVVAEAMELTGSQQQGWSSRGGSGSVPPPGAAGLAPITPLATRPGALALPSMDLALPNPLGLAVTSGRASSAGMSAPTAHPAPAAPAPSRAPAGHTAPAWPEGAANLQWDTVQVLRLGASTDPSMVQDTIAEWLSHPVFAWQLLGQQHLELVGEEQDWAMDTGSGRGSGSSSDSTSIGSGSGVSGPGEWPEPDAVCGVVLCWGCSKVVVMQLPAEGASAYAIAAWGGLRAALAAPGATTVCFRAAPQLSQLLRRGIVPCVTIEDPLPAFWLTRGSRSQDGVSLRGIQQAVAEQVTVRVVGAASTAEAAACRDGVLALVVMPRLRALLTAQGMLGAMDRLERPLVGLAALAHARGLTLHDGRTGQLSGQLLSGLATLQAAAQAALPHCGDLCNWQAAQQLLVQAGLPQLRNIQPPTDRLSLLASLWHSQSAALPPHTSRMLQLVTQHSFLQLLLSRLQAAHQGGGPHDGPPVQFPLQPWRPRLLSAAGSSGLELQPGPLCTALQLQHLHCAEVQVTGPTVEHEVAVGLLQPGQQRPPVIAVAHLPPSGTAGARVLCCVVEVAWEQAEGAKAAAVVCRALLWDSWCGTFQPRSIPGSRLWRLAASWPQAMLPPATAPPMHGGGGGHAVPAGSSLNGVVVPASLRPLLVPSTPGCCFMSVALPCLPLTTLAVLCQEPALVAAVAADDPWQAVASSWEASSEGNLPQRWRGNLRSASWHVVQSLTQGTSPVQLGQGLGAGREAAVQVLNSFLAAFPHAKELRLGCIRTCQRQGFTTTLAGRRLYGQLPARPAPRVLADFERRMVSSLLQGSAVDLVKAVAVVMQRMLARAAEAVPAAPPPAVVLISGNEVMAEVAISMKDAALQAALQCCQNEVPAFLQSNCPLAALICCGGSLDQLSAEVMIRSPADAGRMQELPRF